MKHSALKKICLTLAAFAFLALALMALPLGADAQTGGQGKIEGAVVNATKDAKPGSTANLMVTLMSVTQGATSVVTTTAQTDTNGKFVFTNLETISTTRYLVTTRYADVEYYSSILNFTAADAPALSASLSVYDATDDPTVVQVLETHLVVDVQAPWLVVQQIVVLENTSDRVYVNRAAIPHPPTLILPILAKAIDIQFDDQTVDQMTLRGEGVLTYTLPIGPGKDQILFQYAVPYTAPKYDFILPLPHNIARLGLYLVDVGATIQSQQLAPVSNPMSNTPGAPKLIAIAGEKLTAGTTVKATFDKLPAAAATPDKAGAAPTSLLPFGNNQTIGVVVLALAAGAAAVVIAYPILRKRRAHAQEDFEEDEEDAVDDPREDLMQQIADLDDAFEAGEIVEAEYKEKRAALKAQLAEINA
ncbi:MAG: hypothetical protein L0Y55_19850 [Anaerolineales bacterium]|nr:hypothetical protein [Anaerolineales bacterium]